MNIGIYHVEDYQGRKSKFMDGFLGQDGSVIQDIAQAYTDTQPHLDMILEARRQLRAGERLLRMYETEVPELRLLLKNAQNPGEIWEVHNPECLLVQKKYLDWMHAWPNHCSRCDALGLKFYASTQWEPEDIQPCEYCIGAETPICPRCAAPWKTFDEQGYVSGVCTACCWDPNKPNSLPADDGPCYCTEIPF